jgi:hypothetical protein
MLNCIIVFNMDLKTYIGAHEKSVNAFAKRAGVPQPTIWRILNGQQRCGPEIALKLSEATGGKVHLLNILYPGETNVEKTKVSVFRDVGRKFRKLFGGV